MQGNPFLTHTSLSKNQQKPIENVQKPSPTFNSAEAMEVINTYFGE